MPRLGTGDGRMGAAIHSNDFLPGRFGRLTPREMPVFCPPGVIPGSEFREGNFSESLHQEMIRLPWRAAS